jgi:hypothetical protein
MRNTGIRMLRLVTLMASVVFLTPAWAALPPGSYDKLKAQAQEKLKIKVVEVKQQGKGPKLKVTFAAEVLQVERSATGLKPGDRITIQSYRWTRSYAGPKNPPVLPKGWVGVAYLNKATGSGKNYKLAAYGESFEPSP